LQAYNFAKRLKTLRGLTVFEFINEKWTSEPDRFRVHPDHLIPGPNI
ncbi:MAG: IS481 family transposase, partial [Minwuia sp.]|nr:IS481 family transposase [Minwuia sp.]MDF1720880.1 IS481 family transposase [Minwuia sp.]MDF1721229.1 IS481 family transposase [Minwuia sp.]